jgi:N-acetylmuramic acid 6-phosphate etherase
MSKITESESRHRNLEKKSVRQILVGINEEDHLVPGSVKAAIPMIEKLVERVVIQMEKGGRLFYIGAGTSGRLGILDASECPPTFGVPHDLVIGLIAGGDRAIRKAVEFAEDSPHQAWKDLKEYGVDQDDFVIGIAASGTTPYVVPGLKDCRAAGVPTGCITCNPETPVSEFSDYPVEVIVGPEYVTGSTRMKAGTAQKLVLNMISTATMIKLGRVLDHRMVDMQLTNDKLVKRGIAMIRHKFEVSEDDALALLNKYGSVREVYRALESS